MFSKIAWIVAGACLVLCVTWDSPTFANESEGTPQKKNLPDWEKHAALQKSEKLGDAIARAYAVLETGVKNYPSNRQCFSCHHQTLPLLSMSLKDRMGLREAPQIFWNDASTKSILSFTEASFAGKTKRMREGQGVGGKALTVAYGLWAMDLAGAKRNETIEAMIDYLLKTQAGDGAWDFQSMRPPAASSRSMTTAIAIYGLRAYGPDYIESNRLHEVFHKAREWSLQANESESQEELNGMAWLDYMINEDHRLRPDQKQSTKPNNPTHDVTEPEISSSDPFDGRQDPFADLNRLAKRTQRILSNQNDDGGWGQTEDMPSDAYATGQTLLILAQVEYRDKKSIQTTKAFRKGIKFLLDSQESDGSWHVVTRSKPVQVFFDNGDPHGKDQFISVLATNWAVAALANFQAFGSDPLESFQVVSRRKEKMLTFSEQTSKPLNASNDASNDPFRSPSSHETNSSSKSPFDAPEIVE